MNARFQRQRTTGFTIVELLIVIVVIAILAAISIVAYTGIQNSAHDSAVKSDFANFIKKYELVRIENTNNQYPNLTAAMGFSFSKGAYTTGRNNMYVCVNPARDQFAIGAQSRSGKSFRYSTSTGTTTEVSSVGHDNVCVAAGATAAVYAWRSEAVGSDNTWRAWAN